MPRIQATPQQAAVILRRRAQQIDAAARRSEKETLKDALRIALRLSSGPYSLAQLREMGHPYAARHIDVETGQRKASAPALPADPAIINAQSGLFRDSWVTTGPFQSGSGLVSRLKNTARYAVFLFFGTTRMIPRPIAAAIQGRVRDVRYRRLREAVRRAVVEGSS